MSAVRSIIAAIAVGLALATACASQPARDGAPFFADDGMPLGRLSDDVAPRRYSLDLRIDPAEETFSGVVDIALTLARPLDRIWMHGNGLVVEEIHLAHQDGRRIAATFEQKNDTGSALLTLSETAPAGDATLHVVYAAPFNTSSYGLFRQERDERWYAATQFEDTGARMVFPSFDEPGLKVPFDIAVTARTGDAVITNTPETSAEDLGDGWTRRTFAATDPFPTYLIAFAVGPYDVVEWEPLPPNAVRDHAVPLRGVAVAGLGDRLDYALANTAPMLAALEGYFGTPYPFEKLDLIAMPSSFGGAMENAAAITYDEFILLMDDDSPLDQRRVYTYVHAHELAHMWFGDLATPAWWDDIWLNESFAEWLMIKVSEEVWPEGGFDRETLRNALAAMEEDSLASARQIREPVLLDGEIGDAFDSITYEKGAGVLAMFETYLGEEAFRDGARLFIDRFAYKSATSDDFMAAIAEGSDDPDVIAAFRSFLDQPGVPLLDGQLLCPANGAPTVRIRQSRYSPLGSTIDPDAQSWGVPVCVAYSVDGAAGQACALVTRREQTIALDTPSCPSSVHLNADGSGYYRFALDEAGWTALVADVDAYSAREALALVDSLDAAFRAGAASADAYVAGLAALADHPDWDVVAAVADRIEAAAEVLDDEQLASVRPQLAGLFRDRYASLAGATEDSDVLLRNQLARFLALIAEDPDVRGGMTAEAARRIGAVGAPDFSYVDPELLNLVLSVGIQELDARFFDLVLGEMLASDDAAFRSDALGALARVDDPELAARLRETLLSERLRGNEALGGVARQLGRDATQDATWAWIQANGDAVIALASETFRSQRIPGLGAAFCSPELSDEFTTFVESHADALPGYERSLAQAQEEVALCAALKTATADDLLAALAALDG